MRGLAGVLIAVSFFAAPAGAAVRLTFLHTPPARAEAGRDLVIEGGVVGASDLDLATVLYRHAGEGVWRQVELTPRGGDNYRAVISGSEVNAPGIEYCVEGRDFFGDLHDMFASRERPQRISVGEGQAAAPGPPGPGEAGPATASPEATAQQPPDARPSPGRGRDGGAQPPEPQGTPPAEPGRAPSRGPSQVSPRAPREEAASPEGQPGVGAPVAPAPLFVEEDAVTVAAGREQPVADAPAAVSVITAERMADAGARTVWEALRLVPGIETSRDVQGHHRIAVRGMRADPEVLVIYDGQRLNSPYDGRALLELPTDNIARIEVIRGPGSALYGAGAFQAVVNLVPRRTDGVRMAASLGTFGTDGPLGGARVSATASGPVAGTRFRIDGDLDVERHNGYRRPIEHDAWTDRAREQGLMSEDDPAGYTDDGRWLVNLGARFTYLPSREGEGEGGVRLRALYEMRGALAGFFDAVGRSPRPENPSVEDASQLQTFVLLAELFYAQPLPFPQGRFQIRGYFYDHVRDDRWLLARPGFTVARDKLPNGARWHTGAAIATLGAEATAGLELTRDLLFTGGLQGEVQSLAGFVSEANVTSSGDAVAGDQLVEPPAAYAIRTADESRRFLLAAYGQGELKLPMDFALTAGARLDLYAGLAAVHFSPRAAMVWRPQPSTVAKLLWSHAFRMPTFEERTVDTPLKAFQRGVSQSYPACAFENQSQSECLVLEPPALDALELLAEQRLRAPAGEITLRGSVFYNRFWNPIEAVDTSGANPPLENRGTFLGAGGVQVVGAEMEGRYQIGLAWNRVDLAWFRAWDGEADPGFDLLTAVPQIQATAEVGLPLGADVSLVLTAFFGSERRNNTRTRLETLRRYHIPAYAMVNATLRWVRLPGNTELALTLQNLLQQDQRDDVPRPDFDRMAGLLPREGLSAWLALRASW